MKKLFSFLPISLNMLMVISILPLTSCISDNSDILAVKNFQSDLGAMHSKTVEEVVQDVVGVYGTASWSSFRPEGNFSKDVRVVEVNISKKDTIIYKSIKIQFIYNRSTGYVKQGAISVNEKPISLLQWWTYYTNILILNSQGISSNKSSNTTGNTNSHMKIHLYDGFNQDSLLKVQTEQQRVADSIANVYPEAAKEDSIAQGWLNEDGSPTDKLKKIKL